MFIWEITIMGCGCGRLKRTNKTSKSRKKMFDKNATKHSSKKGIIKSGLVSSPGSGRKSGNIKITKKR